MAKIYYDLNTGAILQLTRTPFDEAISTPPANSGSIDFDPSTNPTILNDYLTDPNNCTAPSGVFKYQGVTVPINAASQDYTTISLVKQAITALKGTETLPALATIGAAISAVQAGTATNAQAQLALAVTMRLLGLMAQRLLNNGTLG